jgi:hypothetical protein
VLPRGRRTGSDPVSLGACVDSNDGAVPRVQAEASLCRQRHVHPSRLLVTDGSAKNVRL